MDNAQPIITPQSIINDVMMDMEGIDETPESVWRQMVIRNPILETLRREHNPVIVGVDSS